MHPTALDLLLRSALGDDGFVPATVFFGTDREAPAVVVPGERAIEAWERLRGLTPRSGLYPVLLGTPQDVLELDAARHAPPSPAAMLDAQRAHPGVAPVADDGGPWPGGVEASEGFALPFDAETDAPLPELVLALLPTERSEEVPALLGLAGPDLPDAAALGAALRSWRERFGAEVVGVTATMLELAVESPPETPDAALAVAREHAAIAPATAAEAGSLRALAATRLGAPSWFLFWE